MFFKHNINDFKLKLSVNIFLVFFLSLKILLKLKKNKTNIKFNGIFINLALKTTFNFYRLICF